MMHNTTFRRICLVLLIGIVGAGALVDRALAQSGPAQKPGRPWLVYSVDADPQSPGSGGLWIAHWDGSDKKSVDPGKGILSLAASPDGRYVAYISYDNDPASGEKNITLNLLLLPNATKTALTLLTTPATEMKNPGEPGAVQAFDSYRKPLQWSPDGQTLAFIGAQGQSRSADLFIYSLKTKTIKQLSSGPSQAVAPSWSPDGKYILHFGVNGFGTGAGESYAGAWVARADGSGVTTLYKPTGGGEESLGWIDSTSFLASTWDVSCGSHLIRAFNVDTKQQVIWVNAFYQAAAYAPSAGVLMFSITDIQAGCPGAPGTGLYRLTRTDPRPVKISDFAPTLLEWSPGGKEFYGIVPTPESSLLFITLDGSVSEPFRGATEAPVMSPDGKFRAWRDSHQTLYGVNLTDPTAQVSVKIADNVQLFAWAQ